MAKQVYVVKVDTPYMREGAAAVYLGMKSSRSLQNMRWNGKGPAFLKQGVRVLYRIEDLDAWLNERTVRKTRNSDPGVPLSASGS